MAELVIKKKYFFKIFFFFFHLKNEVQTAIKLEEVRGGD